jgi:hypothetical protein
LPVSGGLKFWTEEEGRYAAFDAYKWFATHVLVPGLPVLNSIVYLTELSLADKSSRSMGPALKAFVA